MISEEVECPQCQHKFYAKSEVVAVVQRRNTELEDVFRQIFALCVRIVPLALGVKGKP